MKTIGFLGTFGLAWLLLDRLATSPPLPIPSIIALAAVMSVLATAELLVFRRPRGQVASALGLGAPALPAIAVAGTLGVIVVAGFVLGAAVVGVTLTLRPDWLAVWVGAMLFHGIAEELVWRGYVFARLREQAPFGRAVAYSVPLIAATHLPIIISSGYLVGGLALATAAVTCLPMALLWERGGRTIWAPALLHGLIGTWQIFDRTYAPAFSIVALIITLSVPLLALAVPRRWFTRPVPGPTSSRTRTIGGAVS